uniref:Uncharacterized protein n=1 Tax=Zea mays TaxID=4577 RepID=B6TRQ6_MAIZE|nr:hypothetical protein [Zea mays]ACG46911.1 hypothetical protein [Zea mays]
MIVTWGKSTEHDGCVREEIKGRASGRRGGFLIGVRCSSLGRHSSSVEHDTSQSEHKLLRGASSSRCKSFPHDKGIQDENMI